MSTCDLNVSSTKQTATAVVVLGMVSDVPFRKSRLVLAFRPIWGGGVIVFWCVDLKNSMQARSLQEDIYAFKLQLADMFSVLQK